VTSAKSASTLSYSAARVVLKKLRNRPTDSWARFSPSEKDGDTQVPRNTSG
jgi:hypothetical protein